MEKYNRVLVVGDVSMFDKMDKGDCEIVRTINVSLDDFDEAVELYTSDAKDMLSAFPKWKGVDAIVLCIRDITELKDLVSQDYMNTVSAVLGDKEDVFMLLGGMGRLQPDLCRDIKKSMMYAGLSTKARYDEPMVKNNIGTGTARGIDTPVQVYAQKFGASTKPKHCMSQVHEPVDQVGPHAEHPQKRLDVYQLDQGMKPYQALAQPTVDFVDAPRACAGCTCGRVQAEAAAAAYHSQVAQVHLGNAQLAQATSACGNCYLGDAFRCAGCPQRGMPAFSPGSMAQI